MAQLYEVYVQGKYYKSFETDDSMALVWKITDLLTLANATQEIPWFNWHKPSHIKVEVADGTPHIFGVITPSSK
jgi:hypothetical protein